MLGFDTLKKVFTFFPKTIDATDSNNIYIGFLDNDSNFYRIIKININGSVFTFLYPDGKDSYEYNWSERTTYTYN